MLLCYCTALYSNSKLCQFSCDCMHEECKAAILHCSLGDWADSVMLDIFAAKIKYYIPRLSSVT